MIDQEGYRVQRWGEDPTWERFAAAAPGPGEARLAIEACGVGLTVLNAIRGDLADDRATLPRVPGHELVGRVAEVGSGVPPSLIGRRMVAYFYLFCGDCPECVAGAENRCRRLAGYVGVHVDGGYAPAATLPVRNLVEVPDGLDPVEATVVPDAVATSIHVCRSRARVGPEDRVAVIGAGGGVGVHLVQVARLFGATVAGLDVSEPKLATIGELDAIPIDSADFDRLDAGLFSGDRPTVIADLLGTRASFDWATRAVEPGGRIVVLTTFRDREAALDRRALVLTETAVLGSRYASRHEVRLAGDLVAEGRVRAIVGQTTAARDAPELHRRLREGSLVGRGALVWGPQSGGRQ
ncbi:MAG: alcohol dehydrogenase catalytic domain-containing protein, partial [Chloroflexota bacterium]|nr:alcohol dehydrogenase catalytic domain-containing protein [Chloroflexota bacterium]